VADHLNQPRTGLKAQAKTYLATAGHLRIPHVSLREERQFITKRFADTIDSLDATAALIRWAKQRRGFEYSQYRVQLWEFVVEIVDAALWGMVFSGGEIAGPEQFDERLC